jgi:hypothetical protein
MWRTWCAWSAGENEEEKSDLEKVINGREWTALYRRPFNAQLSDSTTLSM